jgi:glycosyltransferase involved in cell wall biosynthesis
MNLLVVTPTLGKSRWLEETVASVLRLPVAHRHILVCPEVERDGLGRRFSHVQVMAEPDAGMYAAVNHALKAARDWEAFTYINDDDLLLPGFAATVRAAASSGIGQPLLVYGRVRLIDRTGRRIGAVPISPYPALNRRLYALRLEPVYQHGTLITRAAWEKLGGFDPACRLCGDSELLARACLAGLPFRRVSRMVAAFRLTPGQLSKNRAAMEAERRQIDEKLGLITPSSWRHQAARLAFRVFNLPVYIERIARHGFISFDEMLTRLG